MVLFSLNTHMHRNMETATKSGAEPTPHTANCNLTGQHALVTGSHISANHSSEFSASHKPQTGRIYPNTAKCQLEPPWLVLSSLSLFSHCLVAFPKSSLIHTAP